MTTREEIEQLFHRHYPPMYGVAIRILRNDDLARDIVHDVFETLLVSGKVDVSGSYLCAAVRNRCLKYIRSLSVQDRMKEAYSLSAQKISEEDWPDDDTISLIQTTVSQDLTDACRRVVNLRFTDNKSYQEIADIVGISKVAVYKHLRHAIDILRKKLSQNG